MPSRRVLGVLGTLVRDTIHRDDDGVEESTEAWGGIGYALESLAAGLTEEWQVLPLVKVGHDLAREADAYLSGIPRVRVGSTLVRAAAWNPRVELRYVDGVRVSERISHIPSAWSWSELEPRMESCDALYVNFITGLEMELETALRLRESFHGPIYTDLHSLFLALDREGRRSPRALPDAKRWLRASDAVQVNEAEFHLLFGDADDPWRWAAEAVESGTSLIAVTLEDRGAAYVAAPAFEPDPFHWIRLRTGGSGGRPAQLGAVEQRRGSIRGDSTGCGDVWGSTLFARLLAGEPLESAMARANDMAARNLGFSGADGLCGHLTRVGGTAAGDAMTRPSMTGGRQP